MAKGTTRSTLDFGPDATARLARLQQVMEGSTKVHVFSQALQLLDYMVDQTLQGVKFRPEKEGKIGEPITILGVTTLKSKAQ